jgi:hypothetical protein
VPHNLTARLQNRAVSSDGRPDQNLLGHLHDRFVKILAERGEWEWYHSVRGCGAEHEPCTGRAQNARQ